MSQNYDNWERLVKDVLNREQLRRLALESSRETSFDSISSSFVSYPTTPIHGDHRNVRLASSSNLESLPPSSEYEEIISGSVNTVAYASKRELYLSLCNSPILLDGGKMSFQIDKMTGKTCYMIGAMDIRNPINDHAKDLHKSPEVTYGDDLSKFTPHTNSRFSRVAKLQFRRSILDIQGQIEKQMLSSKTRYAAHLVFTSANFDIGEAQGIIKFVNVDEDDEADRREGGHIDEIIPDGKMEVQLGTFCNELGDDDLVEEARSLKNDEGFKIDVIVEGIELPTTNVDASKNRVRYRREGMFSNLRISRQMTWKYDSLYQYLLLIILRYICLCNEK